MEVRNEFRVGSSGRHVEPRDVQFVTPPLSLGDSGRLSVVVDGHGRARFSRPRTRTSTRQTSVRWPTIVRRRRALLPSAL
jgi:hypothetical protein